MITRGPTLSIDEPELVREGEEADSDEDGKGDGRVVLGAGQLDDAEREKLARQIEETRGVVVKQAPRGMKRARENETAFVGFVYTALVQSWGFIVLWTNHISIVGGSGEKLCAGP